MKGGKPNHARLVSVEPLEETEALVTRAWEQPGDRGTLDEHTTSDGVLQGLFIPTTKPAPGTKAAERLAENVILAEVDPTHGVLRIHPTETASWTVGFLGPKYTQITTITLPTDFDTDADNLPDALLTLPRGFIKDYEYGLGLTKACQPIIDLIEEHTCCDTLELVNSGEPTVDGRTFRMSFELLETMRRELSRIAHRGGSGIHRVKKTYVHNYLADALGLVPKQFSLGRHPTSKWITKVAAGEEPISEQEQEEILLATTKSAAAIAAKKPKLVARLQHEIELVNLDQLIKSYEDALKFKHNEDWWQHFFEDNAFALQLLFGGPTIFIDAQVPIGEGGITRKGKKITDYLFRNALTNNAALVEIKKPSTQLMDKTPYRAGVYGVHPEISKSVIQVLDHALHLTRHEKDTRVRTADRSWTMSAPRCYVVAGKTSELDSSDKRKSFELYREHLSGVRLVTYDEIFEQLKLLRGFLADPLL